MCDTSENDFDYVRGELADIQTELESFPPSMAFAGVNALTERLEGVEARMGTLEDSFRRLTALAAVLPE